MRMEAGLRMPPGTSPDDPLRWGVPTPTAPLPWSTLLPEESTVPAQLGFLPRGSLGGSAAAQAGRLASASTAGPEVGFLGS